MTAVVVSVAVMAVAVTLPATRVALQTDPAVSTAARRTPLLIAGLGAVVLVAVATTDGTRLVLVLIAGAAAGGAMWLFGRGRARRSAASTREVVVEACEALALELRAGQTPVAALSTAAESWPPLIHAEAAARLDADVAEALRTLARIPGGAALTEVAAAWVVAHRSGAGLAAAVERCAEEARGTLAVERVIAAELASAQATARMVALMPVVLLVLADGTGSRSVAFLTGTMPGLVCLGAGLGLAILGMAWIDAIVARVQRGHP